MHRSDRVGSAERVAPLAPRRRPRRIVVVLPAYNEAARLDRLFAEIDATLDEADRTYQVVLVDDGSTDATAEIAARWSSRLALHVVTHASNLGLGATLRDGLVAAASRAAPEDIVVTMDADDTHAPGLILRMVRMITEGHDVVIASRYRPGARTVGVPWPRRLLSRAGSLLFRVFLPIDGVRDFTCGYRAYRAEVIQRALAEHGARLVDQDGFQCMVDLLLKLRGRGLVFGEVPVVLRYDLKQGASKMKVARTAASTLALLVRRRLSR